MLAIAIALSAAITYSPPSDCKVVTKPPTAGTTLRCTSTFPSLGRRTYSVHLPRGFEKGQALPVLVFLQTGEPYANGLLKKLGVYATLDKIFNDATAKKFVFASPDQVMPTEAESSRMYYVTGTTGKFARWHKFITTDFPALVWKRVMGQTTARPDRIAIDGISLGGYNAIQYALSSPTVFRAAACMSAAFYGPGVGFADKKLQMQNRYSDAELATVKTRVAAGALRLRIQTSDAKDARGKPLDSGPSTREVSARWKAAGIAHNAILDGPTTSPPSVYPNPYLTAQLRGNPIWRERSGCKAPRSERPRCTPRTLRPRTTKATQQTDRYRRIGGVYWQGGHRVSYWQTIIEDRFRWHAIELGSISPP